MELRASRSPVQSFAPEPASDEDEIDALWREIFDAAQRAYPALQPSRDDFAAYLRERLPAHQPASLALRELHTADLYLACACAQGDARAFAAFEDRCLRPLDRALGKTGVDADVRAEVAQDIRIRVLVGDDGAPAITEFSGRGDLRSWVRVMAVRLALRRQSRGRREVAVDDDELLQRLAAPGDLGLDRAKGRYRQEFQRAFDAALRALPDRERTVLRQHYLDGLSIDELGRLYRVHRATAARLVGRARALVFEATRVQMMGQLDVPSQDLDSILQLIRSQIEISLHGLRRGRRRS